MKRKRHKKRKRDPPSKLPNAAENFWIDSLENLEFVGQLGQGGFGNVSLLCTYDGVVVVDYFLLLRLFVLL